MIEKIYVCERCGIFEPDSYTDEKGSFHAIPEHDSSPSGHDPETGECRSCPVPSQCGPIKVYVSFVSLESELNRRIEEHEQNFKLYNEDNEHFFRSRELQSLLEWVRGSNG